MVSLRLSASGMPKPGNADFFAAQVKAVNDPIIPVEDLAGHSIVELGDHEGTISLTVSAATPSPRSNCSKPSRTPATNSISRAISWSDAFSGSFWMRSMTISRLLMQRVSTQNKRLERSKGFKFHPSYPGFVPISAFSISALSPRPVTGN